MTALKIVLVLLLSLKFAKSRTNAGTAAFYPQFAQEVHSVLVDSIIHGWFAFMRSWLV